MEWMHTDTQIKSLEHRCIIYVSRRSLERWCVSHHFDKVPHSSHSRGRRFVWPPVSEGGRHLGGKAKQQERVLPLLTDSCEKTEHAAYRRAGL